MAAAPDSTPPTSPSDSGETIPTEPATPISMFSDPEQTAFAQAASQAAPQSGNTPSGLDELIARLAEEMDAPTPISIGPPSPGSSAVSLSSSVSVCPDATTPADTTDAAASLQDNMSTDDHAPEFEKSESPDTGSHHSASTATQSDVPSVFSCQNGHSALPTSQNTTPPSAGPQAAGQNVGHVSNSDPLPYASFLGEIQMGDQSATQSPPQDNRPISEPPRNKRRFIFVEPLTQDYFDDSRSPPLLSGSACVSRRPCQWATKKRRVE